MAADITALVIEVKSTGIKEASQALSGLGTSAANAERKINTLIEATKKLNTINETAAKSFFNVADKMREQDKLLSNMAANSRVSARGVQDLAAAMTLLSSSLNLMNQNIVRAEASTRKNNEAMKEAHALARGLSGSFGALWLTYGNIAGMSLGVAIGAGLKSIVTIGKDVENTLEGIRVRAGESQDSMNKVAEAVERIGKGVYGPQEVAKAFETLALAGLKAKDSTLAIGAALNLATAGGTSVEKAAESLVTIGTAVGATAKEFDMLADGITTAANTSLASVDSIAEAVKRASVVNKLYGASFDDILTQTAALAQLGIKNTAAGTAIVNFYNNSLGQTEKSRKALDALGMSFTDLQGRAKPIVDAFEEFTEKLNKFDLKSQQRIINDIFGERALRDVEALRDLTNTAAEDTTRYANRLREIQGQIAEAAGTAALQSAQLGLTTSKQIETVGNTLKVSLAKAFTELEPTINKVTARLKEVFGSQEFIDGVSKLAGMIAELTAFLVENYKAIGYVVEGFLMWKAVTVGAGIFEMISKGLIGVATSMGLVSAATTTATGAVTALGLALKFLPGIGVILSALTVAWALYNFQSEKAKNNALETAEAYNKNFLQALKDEAERLEKTNEVIAAGTSIKEADTVATRELAMAKLQMTNADAVAAAQADRDKARQALDNKVASLPSAFANTKPEKETKALADAQNALNTAIENSTRSMMEAQALTNRIIAASKEKKTAYEQEAKAARDAAEAAAGGGKFGGPKVDNAAINDQYAAAIAKITADIKAAKKDIQNYDDALNDKFKAGEIGKLQVIRDSTANQLAEYDKIGKKLQEQIDIASKGKNKKADVERFTGLQDANTEAIEQAKRKSVQDTEVYIGKLREDTYRDQVKQLESEGKFVEAAKLRWSTEYAPAIQAVQKDFEKYGDTIPEISERIKQLNANQDAFVKSAAVKEAAEAYKGLAKEIDNIFRAAENASQGQGLSGVVDEAIKAAEKYQTLLPGLQAGLNRLKEAAMASNDPNDYAKYEDALGNQLKLANKYKSTWASVGKSITESLTTAFGKSGKAAGGIMEAIIAYNNTDNKTLSAKNKLYGDVAESAKGFFSESSKGYKILDTVSKAFHAAELARTVAKMAVDVAGGVASLFAQGGWAGFAGAAAFLALMAGLGFSGGGSSSAPMSAEQRQKMNGTGSVLGDSDAKSESILNALEIIAKDSGLGLVHFNSMDKSLQQLVTGISGLSSLLVRGTNLTAKVAPDEMGSVQKLVNGTTVDILDKMLGGLAGKAFGAIFGGAKSVEDVGIKIGSGSLGQLLQGVNASQYTDIKKKGGLFSSDKYSTETKSLGAEINNQFTMVIQSLTDTVKSAASVLGISGTDFENKLKSFSVDIAEISTKDLTGDEIQAALETAFSKLGDDIAKFAVDGLDKFSKVGEGALETLARITNELVQVQDVFAVLGKTLDATGMVAVQISQDLIKAFGSVDKLTESTKYFLDNFLTDAEKAIPVQKSLNAELTRLKLSTNLTTEEFKNLVMSQDLTTAAGQEMYAALLNIAPAFKQVSDAVKDANEKLIDSLKDTANNDFDNLNASVQKERDKAQAAYAAQEAILNAQISSLTDVRKAITELVSSLDSAYKTITGFSDGVLQMSRAQAQVNLDEALEKARKTGILPTAADMKDTLSVLTKDPANSYGSYADYVKDIGITAGKIGNLQDIAEQQGTVADKQLDTAKKQLQIAKDTLDAQNKKFDAIINAAQAQLNAMNGVSTSILTLAQALDSFNTSVSAAIAKQQQSGVIGSNGKPITSDLATEDIIKDVYRSVLGREADAAGLAFWTGQKTSTSQIIADFMKSPEYIAKHPDGSHAGGLDYVPKDNYLARLHKGEKVLNSKDADNYRSGDDTTSIVAAIEKACETTSMIQDEMRRDISKLRKRVEDLSPNGQSLQTVAGPA